MIEKIEITGKDDYIIEESLRKYTEKKLGKLDRYLPRNSKKDIVTKVVIVKTGHNNGEKFEISVAMSIPGGKIIAAKDECTNVFAGIDLLEAKLAGQIRRFKIESAKDLKRKSFKNLFTKKK